MPTTDNSLLSRVEGLMAYMRIWLCYDTKTDYGVSEENMEYTDFVSLHTVSEIKRALERCGHSVEYIGNVYKLRDQLISANSKPDMVFNIAEGYGSRNREALIPSLLEIYHIPYTASDTYAMAVNLNKSHTKTLISSLGIPTPKGVCFDAITPDVQAQVSAIGYPIVLKLNSEGGSMGVTLVHDEDSFLQESNRLLTLYQQEILAEEYIPGKEITVPILGNRQNAKVLGVVLLCHEDGRDITIYDCHMKGADNDITNSLNTGLSDETEELIRDYSLKIHRFLDLRDYSRMDFRVSPDGKPYFLEINTMPSLGRDGSFELCAKTAGSSYQELIGKIVAVAAERYSMKDNR